MPAYATRGRVMGTDAHVVVTGGGPELPGRALDRLRDLEARWSRFRPTSEISLWNRSPVGTPVPVSPATLTLVRRGVEARELTAGRCDAWCLDALERIGYTVSFDRMPAAVPVASPGAVPPRADPAVAPVEIDAGRGTLRRLDGRRFDPGGIGKGLAADLVAGWLLGEGAAGACVNVGGDLRVVGPSPSGDGWRLGVRDRPEDPVDAELVLADGGLATSSRSRRRWRGTDGVDHHHVVDPRTGASAAGPVRRASAIAAEAWQAEVAATVALLDGRAGVDALERMGAAVRIVTDTGVDAGRSWAAFARTPVVSA